MSRVTPRASNSACSANPSGMDPVAQIESWNCSGHRAPRVMNWSRMRSISRHPVRYDGACVGHAQYARDLCACDGLREARPCAHDLDGRLEVEIADVKPGVDDDPRARGRSSRPDGRARHGDLRRNPARASSSLRKEPNPPRSTTTRPTA